MAEIPIIVDYSTKFCADNMQPVFDVAYGALDMASTPEAARTALDVYPTGELYTQAEVTALVASVSNTALNAVTGWWKDEKTGIIVQWGEALAGAAVTFPVAFPTTCFRVFCSSVHPFATTVVVMQASSITPSGFLPIGKLQALAGGAWADASGQSGAWLAIGY